MTAVETYPLTRDDAEHSRLAQQALFWHADAAALFDAAGITRGQQVADLGCGTLHVPALLGTCVGADGTVRAIDNDARLVASLAQRARERGTHLQCGDAYATGWPGGALDAVHARFLAAPAGRLDALIHEMRRIVRRGGLVMLQEPVADSWSIPAAGPAWMRLLDLIRAGFVHRGGDFDAGRALETRLHAAGVREIHVRRIVRTLPPRHPYARLPLAFCDSLAALWRSSGLAGDGELRTLREQVERAVDDADAATTTFTLVQAWGRV